MLTDCGSVPKWKNNSLRAYKTSPITIKLKEVTFDNYNFFCNISIQVMNVLQCMPIVEVSKSTKSVLLCYDWFRQPTLIKEQTFPNYQHRRDKRIGEIEGVDRPMTRICMSGCPLWVIWCEWVSSMGHLVCVYVCVIFMVAGA